MYDIIVKNPFTDMCPVELSFTVRGERVAAIEKDNKTLNLETPIGVAKARTFFDNNLLCGILGLESAVRINLQTSFPGDRRSQMIYSRDLADQHIKRVEIYHKKATDGIVDKIEIAARYIPKG